KRQNTLQTTEPESSVFTNNNNKETPVIMGVDPLSLDKRKGKEVSISKITLIITSDQALINVDDVNNASKNFLNNKKNPQEIFIKK
ncbi:5123_t:CDS:1, partial [Funneliformis mosseae]